MRSNYEEDPKEACVIDEASSSEIGILPLEDYLAECTQKLESLTELTSNGEPVDQVSRNWMLAQVDFIVETIGNENLQISDEMRSNLLQLMLAIANLNEQIRHQAALKH
jgi:hypothetical protein